MLELSHYQPEITKHCWLQLLFVVICFFVVVYYDLNLIYFTLGSGKFCGMFTIF